MNFKEIIKEKMDSGYSTEEIADMMSKELNEIDQETKEVESLLNTAYESANQYIQIKFPKGKLFSRDDFAAILETYATINEFIDKLFGGITNDKEKDPIQKFIDSIS